MSNFREKKGATLSIFMNHCWPVGKSCLIMFPTEGVSRFLKKRSMEEKVRLEQGDGELLLRTVILIIIHSVLATLLLGSVRALSC